MTLINKRGRRGPLLPVPLVCLLATDLGSFGEDWLLALGLGFVLLWLLSKGCHIPPPFSLLNFGVRPLLALVLFFLSLTLPVTLVVTRVFSLVTSCLLVAVEIEVDFLSPPPLLTRDLTVVQLYQFGQELDNYLSVVVDLHYRVDTLAQGLS